MKGEVSLCVRTLPNCKKRSKELLLLAQKERNAICTQRVRLPFSVGLTQQYRLGLVHYFYVLSIYKFATTNTFNCHDTIAFISLKLSSTI